jgi:hypothetical protein
MPNRNRSARKRREAKHSSFVSDSVYWFNKQEAEREYYAAHGTHRDESAAILHPLYAQREKREFFATLPIAGFLYWFMISAIPVQLSRYTEIGRTQTAYVMSRMY